MDFWRKILSTPPTNQLGNFFGFWQSNLKNPLNFSKGPSTYSELRLQFWGCFSNFPAKIFLPSLTLNKGCLLWGCFRENSQKILRPHLFSKLQDHLWGRFRKKRYVAKKVSPLKSVNWAGKPFTFNYKIFFSIPRKSAIILDKSALLWYT